LIVETTDNDLIKLKIYTVKKHTRLINLDIIIFCTLVNVKTRYIKIIVLGVGIFT